MIMKIITTSTLVAALCMLAAGCTTTDSSDTQTAAVVASPEDYLTADQIRETIVGNTVEGVARYASLGNVPFKMFFEQGTRIYRDRGIVRNNVTTAFGTYRIKDEGLICRTSKSRSKGVEVCFRVGNANDNYHMIEISGELPPIKITIIPGRAL